MKRSILVLAAFGLTVSNVWAFDKASFAQHLMKALNLDSRADVKVTSDPTPSNFGDLLKISVTVGGGPYDVYMTKDEKQYFWGFVIDRSTDPDKMRADGINLKKVHAKGSEKAPVTIVEYSDLQCSHCKQAHESLNKELFKAYKPEQVRLVFKHFPLNGHDWAEAAAVACECAANQKESTFWTMQDYFFANQGQIKKDNIKDKAATKAKELGLDVSAFQVCSSTGAAFVKVQNDKKEGASVGVSSTPTLFINGRTRRGFRDFMDIQAVVDEKLKEVKN